MKLSFLHITKNAGTSLEELARKHNINWGRHDVELRCLAFSVPPMREPIPLGCNVFNSFWHIPAIYFDPIELKSFLKIHEFFMVIRNPYTRVLSEFHCEWITG